MLLRKKTYLTIFLTVLSLSITNKSYSMEKLEHESFIKKINLVEVEIYHILNNKKNIIFNLPSSLDQSKVEKFKNIQTKKELLELDFDLLRLIVKALREEPNKDPLDKLIEKLRLSDDEIAEILLKTENISKEELFDTVLTQQKLLEILHKIKSSENNAARAMLKNLELITIYGQKKSYIIKIIKQKTKLTKESILDYDKKNIIELLNAKGINKKRILTVSPERLGSIIAEIREKKDLPIREEILSRGTKAHSDSEMPETKNKSQSKNVSNQPKSLSSLPMKERFYLDMMIKREKKRAKLMAIEKERAKKKENAKKIGISDDLLEETIDIEEESEESGESEEEDDEKNNKGKYYSESDEDDRTKPFFE